MIIDQSVLDDEGKVIFICASLPGQTERQRSFSGRFTDKSIFRFVESIDGRNWSDLEAKNYISGDFNIKWDCERKKGGAWINPAAISCALSHRDKLLSEAVRRNLILCEDDILLRQDFIDLWSRDDVRQRFSTCEGVVLLHYASSAPITAAWPPIADFGKYQIFKLDNVHVASAACYYVESNIASRIRQYQIPIKNCADEWLEMKRNGVFPDIYAVHPSPCRMAGMASTIGYGSKWKSNPVWLILVRRVRLIVQRSRKNIYDSLIVRK